MPIWRFWENFIKIRLFWLFREDQEVWFDMVWFETISRWSVKASSRSDLFWLFKRRLLVISLLTLSMCGVKQPPNINPICWYMGRPCHEVSNNVWNLYVSLMLLDLDLLTLSLGVGLKLPPFIYPVCVQMVRPCPAISKKVWHLYVSLLDFEMALLTLFLGVGLK